MKNDSWGRARCGRVFLAGVLLLASVFATGCTRPRQVPRPLTPTPVPSGTPAATTSTEIKAATHNLIGDRPDIVPGQVIVKLAEEPARRALGAQPGGQGIVATGLDGIDELNRQFEVVSFQPLIEPIAQAMGESVASMAAGRPATLGVFVVTLGAKTDLNVAVSAYAAQPEVIYAEPNFYVYAADEPVSPTALIPDDPYFERQWNMTAIQAPEAWGLSTGTEVVVAVLDSGIAYEDYEEYRRAPDLNQTRFIPGYDFVNNDAHPNDDGGHGTHVAGTIAQSTNNGIGVAGLAYDARLMPVKVLNAHGQGTFEALAQGIYYSADHGAKVINLSLSGRKTSQLLQDAIKYARNKGALIVAAAGNSGGPVEYPAAYDGVLAVGAVDFTEKRTAYSDTGPKLSVVAPGGDTLSDLNGDGYPDGILQQTFGGGGYGTFQLQFMEGTSMAAPHVAGLAALLFAYNPGAGADEVRKAIEASALDLGQAGFDEEYGYGLIQARAALETLGGGANATPAPAPQTPMPTSTFTATPSPTTVALTPTPAATATPVPPTATPPASEDLILNGDFETEDGWTFGLTENQGEYTSTLWHTGQRSALLGIAQGSDNYGYSSVSQRVTIPTGIKRATLTYWTYPVSADTFPRDLQLVLLLDQQGYKVAQVSQALSNARQWTAGSFDLTPYAGGTIDIYFGVLNDGDTGLPTALYVDDVAVVVER